MKKNPLIQSVILFSVIAAVIFGGFAFAVLHHEDPTNRINFSLTGPDGKSLTENHLAGRWKLVSFGFTSCPDVCPTQTAQVASTMKQLDQMGVSNQIVPVFISVDHLRDTTETVNRYLAAFDQRYIGLTGSKAQLDLVTDTFNTHYEVRVDPNAHHGGITVIHSSMLYVVDPYGRIAEQVAFGFDPVKIAKLIGKQL